MDGSATRRRQSRAPVARESRHVATPASARYAQIQSFAAHAHGRMQSSSPSATVVRLFGTGYNFRRYPAIGCPVNTPCSNTP